MSERSERSEENMSPLWEGAPIIDFEENPSEDKSNIVIEVNYTPEKYKINIEDTVIPLKRWIQNPTEKQCQDFQNLANENLNKQFVFGYELLAPAIMKGNWEEYKNFFMTY